MTHPRRGRTPALGSLIAAGVLGVLVLLWCGTTGSLSAWTSAVVSNTPVSSVGGNTVSSGSLAFSHAYQSTTCAAGPRVTGTTVCSGSIAPTAASAATAVSATDAVTDNGTLSDAQIAQSVSAASCATVKLDNRVTTSNPLLPRYATTFAATGPFGTGSAISLNGTNGYAASVTQATLHGADLTVVGSTYGVGVWFKATSGQSGPLMDFGSSPTSTAGTDDQVLWLTTGGNLAFVPANNATAATTKTTTAAYANGSWHFAYVREVVGLLNTSYTTTITVDGATAATTGANVNAYTNTTGYWHLGWAPTGATGLTSAFFGGSVSNLVVFEGGNAPAAPTTAQLASQSAFNTWANNATDHWLLADTGTTTFTGTQPVIGTTSPCTMLSLTWTFTNPATTATTATPLSTFASGTLYPLGSDPGPGVTQTSTITIARGSTYNAYVAGLRLYVPFTSQVATTVGRWPLVFTWTSADSVVYG